MSRRSTERRQARQGKEARKWGANENAPTGRIRQGVAEGEDRSVFLKPSPGVRQDPRD